MLGLQFVTRTTKKQTPSPRCAESVVLLLWITGTTKKTNQNPETKKGQKTDRHNTPPRENCRNSTSVALSCLIFCSDQHVRTTPNPACLTRHARRKACTRLNTGHQKKGAVEGTRAKASLTDAVAGCCPTFQKELSEGLLQPLSHGTSVPNFNCALASLTAGTLFPFSTCAEASLADVARGPLFHSQLAQRLL